MVVLGWRGILTPPTAAAKVPTAATAAMARVAVATAVVVAATAVAAATSPLDVMPRQSAGLVIYRATGDEIEVLLVHPGGPFWARRDEGAWSIPKGEFGGAEEPLVAARREVAEELGWSPDGDVLPLTPIIQKAGKIVNAWAVRGDWDPSTLRSNTFELEWPRGSGRLQRFPEVDRADWFPIEEARKRILPAQVPLLDELERVVASS
jgi:predicted NUDIX family NTP pyrophosphohydrolase